MRPLPIAISIRTLDDTALPENSSLSLGELMDAAIQRGLADHCCLDREALTITIADHQFVYSRDDARLFLQLLFRGLKPIPAPPRPREAFDWRTMTETTPDVSPASGDSPSAFPLEPGSGEDYLDAMLAFARRIHVVENYRKDEKARRVTLYTSATTTELPYGDTLQFLTASITDELRRTGQI